MTSPFLQPRSTSTYQLTSSQLPLHFLQAAAGLVLQAYLEAKVDTAAGMLFLTTAASRENVKQWNSKLDKLEVSDAME